MTDIENLATRLEQAGPESHAELLEDAFFAVFGGEPDKVHLTEWRAWLRLRDRFTDVLDCGAYLSAAETLVDRDKYTITLSMGCTGIAVLTDVSGPPELEPPEYEGTAQSGALALAAACVRAIAGKEN